MKKLLFGSVAVALAIVSVAFTYPSKRASKDFAYFGASLTDPAQVADQYNWRSVTSFVCDNSDRKACAIITVDEAYSHPVAGQTYEVLNKSADANGLTEFQQNISLTQFSGTTYFVSGVSSGTPRNKN